MNIWRINLKPAAQSGIDSRQHCLSNGLVGIGWQVERGSECVSGKIYEDRATVEYYNEGDKSWWPAWNALYHKSKIGDLIWTRDNVGIYYLGRIISDWFYDTSKEASKADIVNVKKCDWKKIGTIESVPGKLVNSFIPARTIQCVNDSAVSLFSQLKYNELSESNLYSPKSLIGENIYSLLSSGDCEDALALYLQLKENYAIVPSSCKYQTMAYEYELVHRVNRTKAVVQVKNGHVNLDAKRYKNIDSKVYLFTTKGNYFGTESDKVVFVDPEEIRKFLYEYEDYLPDKMKIWVRQTMPKI